jgi:hypothetical protein
MRTPILTFVFVMGMAAAFAMPLAPSAGSSNVVLVHGCHHYYAQDISGCIDMTKTATLCEAL